jgi:hypothetical protein
MATRLERDGGVEVEVKQGKEIFLFYFNLFYFILKERVLQFPICKYKTSSYLIKELKLSYSLLQDEYNSGKLSATYV